MRIYTTCCNEHGKHRRQGDGGIDKDLHMLVAMEVGNTKVGGGGEMWEWGGFNTDFHLLVAKQMHSTEGKAAVAEGSVNKDVHLPVAVKKCSTQGKVRVGMIKLFT